MQQIMRTALGEHIRIEDIIKKAPDFTQEQMEFLKQIAEWYTWCYFCLSSVHAIAPTIIASLEEEMFSRGLIKKDYEKLFWGDKGEGKI